MIGLTLGRYLSSRFFRMIMAVFATIFSLVFVVDFVELLRRTGSIAGGDDGLCRLPVAAAHPGRLRAGAAVLACYLARWAVFLNLTRKLELLVARASGVSVWQFLAPPVMIALAIGILSVTVLNPLSAHMKERADVIEAKLFGGQAGGGTSTWIRQTGIDGESILRAEHVSANATELDNLTAYIYDDEGRFSARIRAAKATLQPGFWRLDDGQVSEPGEPARDFTTYLLATNLKPGEASQGSMSAEAVPFWDLPTLRDETESAGLDGSGYRLQFQTLLARPLLLVAMTLIAAAFSLRFFRFGGIGKFVGGGVAAGFVLYVATKFVGDLGGSGVLSPPVAAWSPAIVATMLGTLALLNLEDG